MLIIGFFVFLNLFQTRQYREGFMHFDGMTKESYWAIFLKSDRPENLDELFLLCNRIAVLYAGRIMDVLSREQYDKYVVGRLMSGVVDREAGDGKMQRLEEAA